MYVFSGIRRCGTSCELMTTEFDFLIQPKSGLQMRSAFGRVDIVTPLTWTKDAPRGYADHKLPPASTQCRNLANHITPSLFFGGSGALSTLDPRTFFPSDDSTQTKFIARYNADNLYAVYIRIIFSTFGFNEEVLGAVKKYNQSKAGLTQPIILICAHDHPQQIPGRLLTGNAVASGSAPSTPPWKDVSEFAIPTRKASLLVEPVKADAQPFDFFSLPMFNEAEREQRKRKREQDVEKQKKGEK